MNKENIIKEGIQYLLDVLPQATVGLSMYNFAKLTASEEERLLENYSESQYLNLLIRKESRHLETLSPEELEKFNTLDQEILYSVMDETNSCLLSMAYAITRQEKYLNKINELLSDTTFPAEFKGYITEHLNNQQRFQDIDLKDIEGLVSYLKTSL